MRISDWSSDVCSSDLSVPAHARGGRGFSLGIIHVRAERVQRHTTFAIPFGPCDFRAAETTSAGDPDAFGTQAKRRLHSTLHRAAECDTTLQLIRDRLRHQLRVDLRLPDFDDIEADIRPGHRRQLATKLLAVRALLADDHPRHRGKLGRAECRGRVCQYRSILVVAVSLTKKKKAT